MERVLAEITWKKLWFLYGTLSKLWLIAKASFAGLPMAKEIISFIYVHTIQSNMKGGISARSRKAVQKHTPNDS